MNFGKNNAKDKTNILIVGGGPVGLLTVLPYISNEMKKKSKKSKFGIKLN